MITETRLTPGDAEADLSQTIMLALAGHTAEDAARALACALALVVSHEHHENGDDLALAELTLTRAGHLARSVLRNSWGQVELMPGASA